MTISSPRRATSRKLTLAAVSLAALGLGCSSVAGSSDVADRDAVTVPDLPALACAVSISKARGGFLIEGQVQSSHPVAGQYDLKIEKSGRSGSAVIHQSGGFSAAADTTETVGTATLNGRRSDIDVDMSITVDGTRLQCGRMPVDL